MLDLEDAGGHAVDVVLGRDRDRSLEDDRAVVDALIDEMNGRAGDPHAVLDRLTLRVQPFERGQQRRMDVDDALRKARGGRVSPGGRTSPDDEADARRPSVDEGGVASSRRA